MSYKVWLAQSAVASNTIEVVGLKCSEQVEHAMLLTGSITTEQFNETESIFCALMRWKQRDPSLVLDGLSHLVDQDCGLEADSSVTSECSSSLRSSTGFLTVNKLLIVLVVLLLSFINQ